MTSHYFPIFETRLVRKGRLRSPPTIHKSQELFETVKKRFRFLDREQFAVLYLDTGLRPIGFKVEGIGSASQCLVDTRLLLKDALVAGASAIALIHNHPSGERSPSSEDRNLTARIHKACITVGIKLIEHLIICDSTYFSFADSGELNLNA